MSLHIFMVITSMRIWCSVITVNTQQSWQIAWSRIQIPWVQMGEKTLTLPLPDCPRWLFLCLLPTVLKVRYIPGCQEGTAPLIFTRMLLSLSVQQHPCDTVMCADCVCWGGARGCQALIELPIQVGCGCTFGLDPPPAGIIASCRETAGRTGTRKQFPYL